MALASAGPYANHLHLIPYRYLRQHLIIHFSQTACSSWHPANSVKALKALGCWLVGLSTPASSLKDVDITRKLVVICPQPLAGCKPKPTPQPFYGPFPGPEADTLTIRLGATPSRLTGAHFHHHPPPPYFIYGPDALLAAQPTVSNQQ